METINPTLVALAGFAGWTALLTFGLVNLRLFNIFSGAKIPINRFSPSGEDLPGLGLRLTRAHQNCLETLPIFAALVIVAGLSNQLSIMEGTAIYILFSRVAQSITHIISTSVPMVLLRATLFTVQVLLMLYYSYRLLF